MIGTRPKKVSQNAQHSVEEIMAKIESAKQAGNKVILLRYALSYNVSKAIAENGYNVDVRIDTIDNNHRTIIRPTKKGEMPNFTVKYEKH